jgi:hypothetical protein
MHYFLTASRILTIYAPKNQLHAVPRLSSMSHEETFTREDILEHHALHLCSIAFTASSQCVLVNTFGPISTVCDHPLLRRSPD